MENGKSPIAEYVLRQYPGLVFKTGRGFGWKNLDGEIFTFPTENEAAEDVGLDMGVTLAEAL